MRDYVIINGVNSLTINGLAISKLPPISKPLMRNMKEEIDGRDGDIITELGYSAYDKEMEIGLYGNFDINEVISFFNGEGTITFSNEDDKHYYFKILEQIDYEKLLKFKTATITFHCQPFKYPNNETIIEADSVTVEGTGTSMSLSNTTLHESIKTDLLGDTFQNGTPTPTSPITVETVTGGQKIKICGKNILPINITSGTTINGLTITKNDDGYYILNGTTTANTTINLYSGENITIPSGTYTGSIIGRTNIVDGYIRLNNGAYQTIFTSSTDKNTFTINDSFTYNRFYIYISNGKTFNNQIIKPMLEVGNQQTNYELYENQIYEINLGKNLLDLSLMSTSASTTYTWENDILTVNGTTTYNRIQKDITQFIKQNGGKTLRVDYDSFDFSQGSNAGVTLQITNNGSTSYPNLIQSNGTVVTYTIPANTSTITQCFIRFISNNTGTSSTTKIIINKPILHFGAEKTSYVPYKEPVELCKIGDYQDFIRKGTGSNLFDKNTTNILHANLSNSVINSSPNERVAFIKCKPNTIYTLYEPLPSSYIRNSIGTTSSLPTFGMSVDDLVYSATSPKTITTNANAQYIVWLYYSTSNIQITEERTLNSMQINIGNTKKLYEPYGFKDKWYLYKTIDKIILNGTESWTKSSSTAVDRFLIELESGMFPDYSNKLAYCDKFNYRTGTFVGTIQLGDYLNNTRLFLDYSSYGTTTLADFKTWLSSNNTLVNYVLTTPTSTEITDSELLEQLNLLSNATGYEGTTNISSSGYLPTILNVNATATPTTTITNIGNIYAKPLLTIRGSGDISVYLNGIQLLQIALGDREEITIDISKMEAYDEETKVLLNRLVIGDYSKFLINSGNNELIITGDVSNFSMSGYTRWL